MLLPLVAQPGFVEVLRTEALVSILSVLVAVAEVSVTMVPPLTVYSVPVTADPQWGERTAMSPL